MKTYGLWLLVIFVISLLTLSGCNRADGLSHNDEGIIGIELPDLSAVPLGIGSKLDVVATTSIVADVVMQVGGDNITLKTLIPRGADPHAFEPTPQDIAAVADAHVVFSNGLGLEAFLDTLVANAGGQTPVVPVSYGIQTLEIADHDHAEDDADAHEDEDIDPHTWFDPNNVVLWTLQIKSTLQALDPDNASLYEQRANAYQRELEDLDTWISSQVTRIPEASRKLVTDHLVFNYFAHAYGFVQIGTIVPGYNASAQPSAQELAKLERSIQTYAVKAIFVGKTANPDLAQQIAADMGIELVYLYTGSLSNPGEEAGSYIDFMRYNTRAIIESIQ